MTCGSESAVRQPKPAWPGSTGVAASRVGTLVVALLGFAFAAILSYLAILRHQTLHSHAYDLAIFDQILWNTRHGRWLETSLMPYSSASSLGDHFSPILAPLALVYLVWDDVRTLLILQSVCVGLGALPIYWLARLRLRTDLAAVALAAAYLLFPTFAYGVLFDYHPETLLVPLLPLALYFLHAGRPRAFLLTAATLLLVKEDVALTVFMLGFYATTRTGWRVRGLALAAAGLAWFLTAIYVAIPAFRGEPYMYFSRYGHLGGSTWEIVLNLLGHPRATAGLLLQPDRRDYLLELFGPAAWLPLLGPAELAVALPVLAGNLLSSYEAQRMLVFQYSLAVAPVLFVATLEALRRLQRLALALSWTRPASRALPLAGAALVLLATLSYLRAHNAVRDHVEMGSFRPPAYAAAFREAAALLPPDASLTSSNALAPHLAHRPTLVLLTLPHKPRREPVSTDYVLLNLGDDEWSGPEGTAALAARFIDPARYRRVFERDGIVVFRREGA